MAQIVVRKLEDEVKEGLRRRAARHGRSLEAEVREILRDAAVAEPAAHSTSSTDPTRPSTTPVACTAPSATISPKL